MFLDGHEIQNILSIDSDLRAGEVTIVLRAGSVKYGEPPEPVSDPDEMLDVDMNRAIASATKRRDVNP